MEERVRCARGPMWLHLSTLLLPLLVQGGAPAGTRLHDSKLSQITQLHVAEGLPGADHRRVWGRGGQEWTGSQRHSSRDDSIKRTEVDRTVAFNRSTLTRRVDGTGQEVRTQELRTQTHLRDPPSPGRRYPTCQGDENGHRK